MRLPWFRTHVQTGAGLALALCLGLLSNASASPAAADKAEQANELAREGNDHGRRGELSDAISKFKEALALSPQALFACNIGLAYARQHQWPEAHYFLSECRRRWSSDQERPIESWVDARLSESVAHLETESFAPAVVQVVPNDASIRIPSFSDGDRMPSGRRIWLPHGEHQVTISHPDYPSQTHSITIASSRDFAFSYHLDSGHDEATSPGPQEQQSTNPPMVTTSKSQVAPAQSNAHWFALGIGVAFLAAGGATHSVALGTLAETKMPQTESQFSQRQDSYKIQRAVTYGLYGAGSAALGLGIYWALSDNEQTEMPPVRFSAGDESTTLSYGGRW